MGRRLEFACSRCCATWVWHTAISFYVRWVVRNEDVPFRVAPATFVTATDGRGVKRYFYAATASDFCGAGDDSILGVLAASNTFALEPTQRDAWQRQIEILKQTLTTLARPGHVYFEYSIPRVGKRVDCILLMDGVVFVVEFKVGESTFHSQDIDQVWDYALDLKNFHETSHHRVIAPVLVATEAPDRSSTFEMRLAVDQVVSPVCCNGKSLAAVLHAISDSQRIADSDLSDWQQGRYSPTPTIIEAAMALYRGHAVEEISRTDADASNLTVTNGCVESVISWARANHKKAICFVTGVPGAGKTLVGLDIATTHADRADGAHSVFLSGNGPLVAVLQEALARDKVSSEKLQGRKLKKGEARRAVKSFIQNIHHFRDECIVDAGPPFEHVAIFDEAQRAWNLAMTQDFMKRKKQRPNFDHSEPEFLISCLDRHDDWAVVVCLVGGGQEINRGEAGIGEWIDSVLRSFPDWHLYLSSRLTDSEYAAGKAIELASQHAKLELKDELHLGVSMRSFRAESVSAFVKYLLDLDVRMARDAYSEVRERYPIVITRDFAAAKQWIRSKARGSERYGLVVSSAAQRLKPYAIDVRTKTDPVQWFLGPKTDVRSSFYLEDVATEFQVQGLELDWTCVAWDADFRRSKKGWDHFSFRGEKWQRVKDPSRQEYLKNAYRVLLTRARQGMVIVVPEGDAEDPTRMSSFYDDTYKYLQEIGLCLV